MSDPVQTVFGSLVAALGCASLLVWVVVFSRLRAGQPIVQAEPREGVPWRAIDLYLILIFYLAAQFACAKLVISLAGRAPDAARSDLLAPVLLSNALANALLIGLSCVYLRLRCGPRVGDLGFLPWRPGRDLLLGLTTFIAALLPVFAIQFVLTRLVSSEHPVQQLLTKDSSPRMLVLCVVSAVAVAPLAEEFLFRVLLQGWMEAVVLRWRQQRDGHPMPVDSTASEAAVPPLEPPPPTEAVPPLMPLPIVASSLLFALVHLGHGPDPIPLFVLALMLGYLYQKTHRIWPGVIVHACLNAWSLAVLWLSLRLGWTE